MTKAFKPKIVSANDLFDGDVVYLDASDSWTRHISDASVARSDEEADALLARADQPAKVVGPYLLDVTTVGSNIQPDHFRERFRETGPTLDAEFARPDHVNSLEEDAA